MAESKSTTKKRKWGTACAYKDCGQKFYSESEGDQRRFFRFPQNKAVSEIWIKNCGRDDLLGKHPKQLFNNFRLCSEHFEDEMFYNSEKHRLLPLAVPKKYENTICPIVISVIKNPVISTSRKESLRSSSLNMEDKIKKYSESETEESSNKSQVELNSALAFEAEYTSNYENNCINKRKRCDEDELHDEIKLEPKNLAQKELQEFPIKHEIIDHDEADYVKIEKLNDNVEKCQEDAKNYEILLKCENLEMQEVKMETENALGCRIKLEGSDIEMEDGATTSFKKNVPSLKDALGVDLHQCKICKKHLTLHENVSEIAIHQCEECNYKIESKCCLDTHKLIHRNDSKEVVYLSDLHVFQTGPENSLHWQRVTHKNASEVIFPCSLCPYKAKRKDNLKRHMLTHKPSEEATYSCDVCTYKANQKEHLKRHMLVHKTDSEVTFYPCETCTYKTKLKGSLQRHMLIHKNACELTTYSCDICIYKTNYKGNLKQHMLTHKNASEVTMYSCGICTYKSKHKGSLKDHMLIHKNASEVTMYPCKVCTFQTKREGDLRKHMLTHKNVSEVATYSCTTCAYITKRKRNLNDHMLIHKNVSELTMYSCEMCTYKAKRKSSVKQHMLVHRNASEVTMYLCEMCAFQTKQKSNLKQHMLIHNSTSQRTVYSCKMCTFKAKYKSNLNRHMAQKHPPRCL